MFHFKSGSFEVEETISPGKVVGDGCHGGHKDT